MDGKLKKGNNMEILITNGGFSIEMKYNKDTDLIRVGNHKNIPLFEVIGGEITDIAYVKTPAIGLNATQHIEKNGMFLTGPVLIPDKKIYRNEPDPCYIFFTDKTIAKLKSKFDGTGKKLKNGH